MPPIQPTDDHRPVDDDDDAPGTVGEFWEFLRYNKKWWLLPIVVALLLLAGLMMFAGSAAAPFIYPFF